MVEASSRQQEVRVEGHKLLHHVDRLVPFMQGERIYPLYVEFSPVGSCNHRCTFCAYDYIGYPDRRLDTEPTLAALREMGKLGVKSAVWAGEGEPLLHPELDLFLETARESGIENGIFTNASALTGRKAERILPHLTFLRVSFNGGDRDTYAQVHKVDARQYDLVIRNLERAVQLREDNGWNVTLGMQIVLLPENLASVAALASVASELGIDYLSLKPFVQHPDQQNMQWEESYTLEEIEEVASAAEAFSRPGFSVLVRRESFAHYHDRSYKHCHALPFFAFVLSDGTIYTCGPYYGNEDHAYGNIYERSFKDIWDDKRTAEIHNHAACSLDVSKCMPNCRPDAANRFLAELKNPPAHVNFI